ncbi:MAG: PAS domain S-box protein [Rhodobacteraceae bacterium]|nr:PAS domain S-box protein [Paracoccaceae bacterium]
MQTLPEAAPILHTDDIMLAAFHAMPAALAIVDQFGTVVARNRAFNQTVGWPACGMAKAGPTFDRLFALTDQPRIRLLLNAARLGQANDEARLQTTGGSTHLVRVSASRVQTLGRGPMVAISLVDSPVNLAASSAANSAVSSVASMHDNDDVDQTRIAMLYHDLRTPLNAIQGFGEMLAGDVLRHGIAHQYRAYAEHIVGAASQLLSSFERVLAVRPHRRAQREPDLQNSNVIALRPVDGGLQNPVQEHKVS